MTRKAIIDSLLQIFHQYGPNETVAAHHVEILRRYIDPYLIAKKKRDGVTTKILTCNDNMYRSVVLYYYNEDGEKSTASIPKAVRYYFTGDVENQYRRFYEAIRNDVGSQIVDYKKSLDTIRCELCNTICERGQTQTDHYPTTFKTLMNNFFKGNHAHEVKKDGLYLILKSETLSAAWKEYHLKHAGYRELCVPCHKSVTF